MSDTVTSYRVATIADGHEHLAQDLEDALAAASKQRTRAPRELLVRATLSSLVSSAAVEWLVIGLTWAALAACWLWAAPAVLVVVAVAAVVVIAGRLHALGVILHDAVHMPLRGKPPLARVLEVVAGFPIATTLNAMRYHHLRHHRDSGMATDPYKKPVLDGRPLLYAAYVLKGAFLLPFWFARGPVGVFALAVPALRNFYGRVFLQDRSGEELRAAQEVVDCARAEVAYSCFVAAVVIAVVVWPAPLLLGYVVPATLTGIVGARRVLREHNYELTFDRRMDTLFQTTNDHGLSLAGRLLLAPRNIGYHVVHHLHPQVTLCALPALRNWYRQEHPPYPAPR
ncbi:MAG: fatty acid desaturase [Deltaproteobacteria bacterium]|nr:fatty acid desaturase [Deltaproteobacteria bacterium]